MVKRVSLFIVMLFISCGIKTTMLSNRITVVPVSRELFKSKILFKSSLLKQIDVESIYKEEFGYQCKENSFEKINNLKEYRSGFFRCYYKFYSNGCINSFLFQNLGEVTLPNINPAYNGERGVLYMKEDEIRLDLFTIKGYSFKRDYGIVTSIIKIKGDTLYEKEINNLRHVNVYLKKKLSKEFLVYKPDW